MRLKRNMSGYSDLSLPLYVGSVESLPWLFLKHVVPILIVISMELFKTIYYSSTVRVFSKHLHKRENQ